jgi:hypothetical protein
MQVRSLHFGWKGNGQQGNARIRPKSKGKVQHFTMRSISVKPDIKAQVKFGSAFLMPARAAASYLGVYLDTTACRAD